MFLKIDSVFIACLVSLIIISCNNSSKETSTAPTFELIPSDKFYFKSFVDCNMAEAWVGDTFRIFPGKYGEDPLWGDAHDLKYADGRNALDAFSSDTSDFR